MERVSVVEEGIRQYIKVNVSQTLDVKNNAYVPEKETRLHVYNVAKDPKELPIAKDITVSKHGTNKPASQRDLKDSQNKDMAWKYMTVKEKIQTITSTNNWIPDIELSSKDKEILRKLELEHEKNINSAAVDLTSLSTTKIQEKEHVHTKAEPKEKLKSKISVKPKQSVSTKITSDLSCVICIHLISMYCYLIYIIVIIYC